MKEGGREREEGGREGPSAARSAPHSIYPDLQVGKHPSRRVAVFAVKPDSRSSAGRGRH